MGHRVQDGHAVLWVTDFPLVEWNGEEQRAEALHHPFTAPNPEDMADLSTARALAYDLVYNGVEVSWECQVASCEADVDDTMVMVAGVGAVGGRELENVSTRHFGASV